MSAENILNKLGSKAKVDIVMFLGATLFGFSGLLAGKIFDLSDSEVITATIIAGASGLVLGGQIESDRQVHSANS